MPLRVTADNRVKTGKSGEGIARAAGGEGREKIAPALTSKRRGFLLACAGENLGLFLDQLAKDGRNLFKLG